MVKRGRMEKGQWMHSYLCMHEISILRGTCAIYLITGEQLTASTCEEQFILVTKIGLPLKLQH